MIVCTKSGIGRVSGRLNIVRLAGWDCGPDGVKGSRSVRSEMFVAKATTFDSLQRSETTFRSGGQALPNGDAVLKSAEPTR